MNKVLSWVKEHPWETGALVFLAGLLFLFGFGRNTGQTASGPDANLAAYLQAETAQSEYSDALTATQYQTQAQTEQARIGAAEQVDVNNTWAATETNNNIISDLGAVADNLGTVLTSSSSSEYSSSSGGSSFLWGLFGSGPSSSGSANSNSKQTFVANTQQAAAEEELQQIANSNFNIGN